VPTSSLTSKFRCTLSKTAYAGFTGQFPQSVRAHEWQSRQAIMLRLAALYLTGFRRDNMRRYWMYANYLIAMALAMFGWLWLIASFVRRIF
jgi:hypothetical protein